MFENIRLQLKQLCKNEFTWLLVLDKVFVLHPDKRPHELSDQFVKERLGFVQLDVAFVSSEAHILLCTALMSTVFLSFFRSYLNLKIT